MLGVARKILLTTHSDDYRIEIILLIRDVKECEWLEYSHPKYDLNRRS